MTKKKKIIAVDMDDTIAKLVKYLQEKHNDRFPNHKISYEDMMPFKYDMFHPDFDADEVMDTKGTFFELGLMDEYVVEELKKIYEKYGLIIVTAAFAQSVEDKWKWIQKYLPFIPWKNFIVASRKDLVEADILIDDAIHNVKDWVSKGKPAIVPIHPWNKEMEKMEGVTPIYGWHGATEIIGDVLSKEGQWHVKS